MGSVTKKTNILFIIAIIFAVISAAILTFAFTLNIVSLMKDTASSSSSSVSESMSSDSSSASQAGRAIGMVVVLIVMIPVVIGALGISAIIDLVFVPLSFAKLMAYDKKKGIVMGIIFSVLLLLAILRFVLLLTGKF